jgi:hypothetical protein
LFDASRWPDCATGRLSASPAGRLAPDSSPAGLVTASGVLLDSPTLLPWLTSTHTQMPTTTAMNTNSNT